MSFLNTNSTEKSTIFITGGASGIGLALSQRLIALGHTVIAAGRRQTQLDQARLANPKLNTIQGDISSDAGRIALHEKVVKSYPDVNVLINNAAIANFDAPPLKDTTPAAWEQHKAEIETNLVGTIHLSILFLPHLTTKPRALIINNTSIVAYFPIAVAATYSATKAALHSFTISLRHQLKDTSVQVVEIAPPAVETEATAGKGFNGMNVEVYAEDTIRQLLEGKTEIGYNNDAANVLRASRDQLDATFNAWNGVV